MDWKDKLRELGACKDAMNWIERNQFTSYQEAWQKCNNHRWMRWLIYESLKHNERLLGELDNLYFDGKLSNHKLIRNLYPTAPDLGE